MLEVMLASLISMLVMGGALSLYFFVDGTDRRLQRRYEDVNNLQRIHLVLERVCSSLVMSDRASAARGIGATSGADAASAAIAAAGAARTPDSKSGGAPSSTPGTGDKGGSASGAPRTSSSQARSDDKSSGPQDNRPGVALPRMPPRLLLTTDVRFAGEAAANSTVATGPTEGPGARRIMTQPQRLEVAVSSSPVPSSVSAAALEAARRAASRSRSRDSTSSDRDERERDYGPRDTAALLNVGQGEDEEETSSRVIRGALELRPQRARSRTSRADLPEQVLWELWWVPLAPRTDVDADAPAPPAIGDAYLVASDIAYMQYRMFDDRTRKTTFQASFMQDIPAYVEVEVETARGLKANWLFEVSWSVGNEIAPEQAAGNADGTSRDGKGGGDPKKGGTPAKDGGKGQGGKGGEK
jgi:hypothetical protein